MGKTRIVLFRGRVRPIRRGGWVQPKGRGEFYILTERWKFLVDFLPWKGFCIRARFPWLKMGGWALTPDLQWERPSMKKKSSKDGADKGKHLAAVETEHLARLLPLVEHCCCRQYDDGEAREPGWITLKTIGAAWVVQVKDPDSGMSFQAVGETVDKALDSAALLLGCDEAPWEIDLWLKKRKPSK